MSKQIYARGTQAVTQGAGLGSEARWALAGLSLSMLMPSLDTSIANTGLPTLSRAFAGSFQAVQWVVLAYLLTITTLIVGMGRIGDIVGRRRLLLVGIALFTAASLLCGAAPTLAWLIAARALQGLGAAVMMALTVALAAEIAPAAKTGSVMGLLGTMSSIGTTLGPSLGGILISSIGWRAMFLVNVPFGLLNFALAYRHLPAEVRPTIMARANFDPAGTALLALSLAAYALSMTLGHGHFGLLNGALLLGVVVGVGLFALVESRVASPVIRWATVRDPLVSASLAMSAIVSSVVMTTLVVGPFYLTRTLGLKTAAVGIVLSLGPLIAALTGVPAGRIVDRFGASRMSIAGLGSMATGAAALFILPSRSGIAGYIVPMAAITAGYALFQAANNTRLMTRIRAEQRGVMAGMISLSRNLGLITGAAVMGAVFVAAVATNDVAAALPEAVGRGMRTTFGLVTALLVGAIVLGAANRGSRPESA